MQLLEGAANDQQCGAAAVAGQRGRSTRRASFIRSHFPAIASELSCRRPQIEVTHLVTACTAGSESARRQASMVRPTVAPKSASTWTMRICVCCIRS